MSRRHVIVELKWFSVKLDSRELYEQGLKYFNALSSILRQQNRESEVGDIELVFVLGDHPGVRERGSQTEAEYRRDVFRNINGRYVLYNQLIDNARNQYQAYLDASEEAQKLEDLLSSIDEDKTEESG